MNTTTHALPSPECLTVTVEGAGAMLGIGRSAAYEAVHRDEIPHIRLGGRLLVPIVQLDRMLRGTAGPDPS